MAEKQGGDGELSFVGPSTTIDGKILTEGSIRIDGKVIGELTAKANAAVGEKGIVEGTLTARNVSLAGKVHGSVTALEKLVLEEKSVMKGDVRAQRLVVDEGAVFDGQCSMSSAAPPAKH